MRELGLTQEKTMVFYDSQSTIHLSKNQVYHERTKNIAIRYHFIREIMSQGIVDVQTVSTHENPADMMTKAVLASKFRHCLDLAGICSID